MANLSWEGIAKGIVGMAGSLVLLVAALNLLPKGMISKRFGINCGRNSDADTCFGFKEDG